MSDLLKKLEQAAEFAKSDYLVWHDEGELLLEAKARIEELEAKLAKAVEMALDECPFRWGTPNYDNWWRDRRAILAEIKAT